MEESLLSRAPPRGGVTFLNVARTYIPNTKVECHYTLPPGTVANASDWIGIFKTEASSVRDYHTFVWCVVPEGAAEGSAVHSSVQFQASYLPKPGAQFYQFRYVNRQGRVCGQSSSFQFREPRPMDELVMLEEPESGSDILLVVPKATVLQNQLEESQQERNDLMRLKLQLEGEVSELKSRVQELQATVQLTKAEQAKLMEQYKGLSRAHGELQEERDVLSRQQGDHVARILELEDDIHTISDKVLEKEVELDRVKDSVKALTREQEQLLGQLKEEQADKEQSQAELQASQRECCRLSTELQKAKSHQGQQASQLQRLQDEVTRIQSLLDEAQRRLAELEPLREQLRGTQELAVSSQQKAALLGEELASAASARDRTVAELHRSRLEVANTNNRLVELSLHWREDKSAWSKERAGLLQSMEAEKDKILKLSAEVLRLEKAVQEERLHSQGLKADLAREKDSSVVQLSESKRELTELRAALRVFQKEKQQLQEEKQELLEYMRKLEARLEKVADEKWSEDAATEDEEATPGCPAAVLTDSEDESPEDMRLPSYGPCERGGPGSDPAGPRDAPARVVISQPCPIAAHLTGPPDDSSSDSAEDEKAVLMAAVQNGGEEASLLLPELGSTFYDVASGFVGGPLPEAGPAAPAWKECPICKEQFPESDKDALEEHVDGHFFFSTQDPFTFE
ncbi:calcium-binding and coiled-coil domain-containing protein 1 isoform X4 [Monodelphis domestica]|uniref:calcium-binding and coiled-coil domain-containing protein 1 isoform X4 n=1 Tax=Monodelphis domestica TaxID=13616 RepID=UPI0024E24E4C|nr:calcium-binding and coiled-coil domain-containing protein 1 isoform X4 [Monodelphis domestica]XP_056654016.1 calcium-binding and coiled-coil domain-containing protein 1 isoform X4 [Monodelphis domestica]